MTQEQLGHKADMNYKYLGAIERGEKNPAVDNLSKIAVALDIKMHELFTFEHEIEDIQLLKRNVDDLLKGVSMKEFRIIYRVINAILK